MSSNYGPSSSSSVFPSSLGQSSNINAGRSSTERNANHALNENAYSQNLTHTSYAPDAISTSHDVSTELKFTGTSSSRVKDDTSRTDNAGDATPQGETDFYSMEQYIDYDGDASGGTTIPQPVIESSNASSEIITEASLDQTPTTFSPCLQSGSLFTPEPSPSLQLTLPEIPTKTPTSQLCTTEQRDESATGQGETISNSSCSENNASNDLKGSTSPPLLESDSLFTPNPFSWLALPELPENTTPTTHIGINQQQVSGKQDNATGQGSEKAVDPSRPGIASDATNTRLGFVWDNSESDVLSSRQRHEPNIAPSITQSPVNTAKVKAKRVDKGKGKAQPVTVSAPITQYIPQPNNRTPFPTFDTRLSGPSKGKSKEAQRDSQPASQGAATRFPLPSNDQSTMVSRPMNQYLQQSGSNVNGSIPYITNERPEFVQGSSNKFPIEYNRKNVISQQVSQPNRHPPPQQGNSAQIKNVAVQRDTVSGPVNYQPYNRNMPYMPTIQGNVTNCLQLTLSPQQLGSNHFWPNPSQVTPMAETEFQPSQYRNISHARYQTAVAQRAVASTAPQHSYPNSNLLQPPDQFPSNFPPNFPYHGHGSRTATPYESATYDALWVNEPERSSPNINYNMPGGSRPASIGMQWPANVPVQNIGGGNILHAPQFHANVPNPSLQASVSNVDSYNRAQTTAYSGDNYDDLHHVHGGHIIQWPRNIQNDIQNMTLPHFRNSAPFHLPPPSQIHSSSAVLTGTPAVPVGSILPHSQPTMQFSTSAPPPISPSQPFPLHTLAPVTSAKRKTTDDNLNGPSDGIPPPKRKRGRPPKNFCKFHTLYGDTTHRLSPTTNIGDPPSRRSTKDRSIHPMRRQNVHLQISRARFLTIWLPGNKYHWGI